MQIINYFLASIISYLGIALGIILIYIAPEEQKHGKGYFLFLRNIFFMLILLFLLFFYYKSIFIVLFVVISLIVFLSLNKKLISGSFKQRNSTNLQIGGMSSAQKPPIIGGIPSIKNHIMVRINKTCHPFMTSGF